MYGDLHGLIDAFVVWLLVLRNWEPSWDMRSVGVMPTSICPFSRAESHSRCWTLKEKGLPPDTRSKFSTSLNECTRVANQDGCLLWGLWCGQSVLPLNDSSMMIGRIDANLGLQIVLQDCGSVALAEFLITGRPKTKKCLQSVTNGLWFVTDLRIRFAWLTIQAPFSLSSQ